MKQGFIKTAAATIRTTVADTAANTAEIEARIAEADAAGVNLLVFPELTVTGFSCGDLFLSETLQHAALIALGEICDFTAGKYPLVLVGVPIRYQGKLYNCAAAVFDGELLALIPKTNLCNYSCYNEVRCFTSGAEVEDGMYLFRGRPVPFGVNLLLRHAAIEDFTVGAEICEDLWVPNTPGEFLARSGAAIIANLAASDETADKGEARRALVSATSARLLCGYVFCNAGFEESTQDFVLAQQCLIAENGKVLAENPPFGTASLTVSEIDVSYLAAERLRQASFTTLPEDDCMIVLFDQPVRETALTRKIDQNPFLPDEGDPAERAERVLQIQSYALRKRLAHAHSDTAVIGISGGLDSCLALLVTVRAFDLLDRPRRDIIAVTMPGFGTTGRTKGNAETLCEELGVTLRCIPIGDAVQLHFRDIGHDPAVRDVTYENSQARERTQILMDISNDVNGMVVGTGDLSELALGWATYNGDHMSMYGVNASVPKTQVRFLVGYEADRLGGTVGAVLRDVLDTPVSPELLPADSKGNITQKTEDLVGPYELHDFFIYYLVRRGYAPAKIYRLARYAFKGEYDDETIKKWLRTFIRRFFIQQFKRSCIPDGPATGPVSLSPRAGFRMPSDAVSRVWLDEVDQL